MSRLHPTLQSRQSIQRSQGIETPTPANRAGGSRCRHAASTCRGESKSRSPRVARPSLAAFLAALAVFCLLPGAAHAQGSLTYGLNLLAGIGGALDEDDPGLSNSSIQLGFSVQPEDQLLIGLRGGEIDFGDEVIAGLRDATVEYLTLAGEYRFTESFYESGLYLGLGFYRFDGQPVLLLPREEETSVGLVLGITGEFLFTEKVGLLVELSGHFANLDSIDTVVAGHAGLSIHF